MPAITPQPFRRHFRKRTDPSISGGSGLLSLLLEALAAEDRPSLCRLEGNGGLLAALRTGSAGFRFVGYLSGRRRAQYGNSLRLTHLAAFRFVLELLVVEKQLFACSKNKIGSAVDTLQYLVLEFHPSPHSPPASRSLKKARGFPCARVRSESLPTPPQTLALDSAHLRVNASHSSKGNTGHGPWRKSSASECETRGKGMGHRPHGSDPSVVSLAPYELFCDCVSVPRLP